MAPSTRLYTGRSVALPYLIFIAHGIVLPSPLCIDDSRELSGELGFVLGLDSRPAPQSHIAESECGRGAGGGVASRRPVGSGGGDVGAGDAGSDSLPRPQSHIEVSDIRRCMGGLEMSPRSLEFSTDSREKCTPAYTQRSQAYRTAE